MNWKRLLGAEAFYSRKYGGALALDSFLVLLIGPLILTALAAGDWRLGPVWQPLVLVGIGLVSLLALIRIWLPFIVVGERLRSRRYRGVVDRPSLEWINQSASGVELDGVDRSGLIASGDGWRLYDIVFDFHRRTKYGRYKSRESFYTVLEIRLRRTVPHLVFDSKTAKGRQFTRLYLKAQQLEFAASLSDRFAAYAPKHYQIDALSFITPEVVEVLLELEPWDFEFLDDRLLCYAPLLADGQLAGFQAGGLKLWGKVDDNLASYRDDWAADKKQINDFGQQLLINPYRHLLWLVLAGLASLAAVVLAITQAEIDWLLNRASLTAIISFVLLVVELVVIKAENRRREAAFLAGRDQGQSG